MFVPRSPDWVFVDEVPAPDVVEEGFVVLEVPYPVEVEAGF